MHFLSLPTTISQQDLAIILGALLLLIILLWLAGRGRRRRRRAQGQYRGRSRGGRPDHGAEVANRHGKKRSPEWHRVEREHLRHEPACVACGYRGKGLQVHHIKPFHLHPKLELDPTNLVTLCEVKGRDHHLLLGHLDEWESYNVNVREDARRFHGKSADHIRRDAHWQKAVARRP